MKETILCTGGLGFICSHLTDKLIDMGYKVVVVDGLFIGSNIANANSRAIYEICDLADKNKVEELMKKYSFDYVFNLCAQSHVDRSLQNMQPFIDSNITGMYNLYESIKKYQLKLAKIIHFSTDEVYGEILTGAFDEQSLTQPKNLYATTKLAQEGIARSYFYSDGIKTITTRCGNIYGPRQHGEKFLPTIIRSILEGRDIPVYGKGFAVREWQWVLDAVDEAIFVMQNGNINEVYNISSPVEKQNIDVVEFVLKEMKANKKLIKYVPDRKGHDLRYSLDGTKLNNLGWSAKKNWEEGIRETIKWYVDLYNSQN